MRVLVVVHGFPPHGTGGSEVYADAHARTLSRAFGDDVVVLTREQDAGRPEHAIRDEQRDGLRIVWINNTFRSVRSFEESYRHPAVGSAAERLIDEFRPDVAHVHHLTCLSTAIVPALATRGIPCFLTLHDYWLMCHRGQLLDLDLRICGGPDASGCCRRCIGPAGGASATAFRASQALRAVEQSLPREMGSRLRGIASRMSAATRTRGLEESESRRRTAHMRGICGDVTRFFAPSEYVREQFIRFGIPSDRITHAPYGFERPLLDAASRREPGNGITSADSYPLRLGFFGSLMVSKAPHLLIEAVLGLDEDSVVVDLFGAETAYHGDESYRRRLAPLIASQAVRHHGSLPHGRVPEALASIDALVVPSVWPENSPLVIHEALLAGVPVIASRIGGIPESVQDGRNGLLFSPGDVEDLRRTIRRLVEEPDLLASLRKGIGDVRTIEADVALLRQAYQAHAGAAGRARAARPERRAQRVAAVVLNYRTPDDTFLAVRSLLASRRALDEIIVVDNGDGDDGGPAEAERDAQTGRVEPPDGRAGVRADQVRTNHLEADGRLSQFSRQVTVIRSGRNLGFPGGVNVGIRAALERGADAVLLVNSDVIVPPDCLGILELSADAPRVGIVAPVIASRAMPGRIASAGISYNETTGRMRHRGDADERGRDTPARWKVDAVSGCLMLIRREVFETIGLFDEAYFFSFEDLDFCLRARRAGYDTIVAGDATAYHEGGRSIGAASPDRLYFAARNHLRLAGRAAPHASRAVGACRASAIVALNVAHAIRSGGGSLPRRLGAVANGTKDHLLGRYGARRFAGRAEGAADGQEPPAWRHEYAASDATTAGLMAVRFRHSRGGTGSGAAGARPAAEVLARMLFEGARTLRVPR